METGDTGAAESAASDTGVAALTGRSRLNSIHGEAQFFVTLQHSGDFQIEIMRFDSDSVATGDSRAFNIVWQKDEGAFKVELQQKWEESESTGGIRDNKPLSDALWKAVHSVCKEMQRLAANRNDQNDATHEPTFSTHGC